MLLELLILAKVTSADCGYLRLVGSAYKIIDEGRGRMQENL